MALRQLDDRRLVEPFAGAEEIVAVGEPSKDAYRPPPEPAFPQLIPDQAIPVQALANGLAGGGAVPGAGPFTDRSPDLLRQLDDDPRGAADVAEPVAVLVPHQLADEFGAVGPQAVEDIFDALHSADGQVRIEH